LESALSLPTEGLDRSGLTLEPIQGLILVL
jgi:hypothetical protein